MKSASDHIKSTLQQTWHSNIMNKQVCKILIPVAALIIFIMAYGLFRLWQYRTYGHRLDKAITSIIDTLSADPNYIVTEHIVTKAKEPNFLELDFLNQDLQVCVSKGIRKELPSWGIQLDKIVRMLPRSLRPSRNLYLHTIEDKWIDITAVEPIPDELQLLKSKVTSIGLPRDIRIQFSSYFPDRRQIQQLSDRQVNGMWTID